jgi:hypothetical protein
MNFCLHNIVNTMHIQQLTESILPCVQNIVGSCKYIIILIFYYVTSRLVTLLKFIYASIYA